MRTCAGCATCRRSIDSPPFALDRLERVNTPRASVVSGGNRQEIEGDVEEAA